MKALSFFILLALVSPVRAALDAAKIESLTGLKGKLDEKEGVFKVSYPRRDIQAKVGGVKPSCSRTKWTRS